MASVIAAPLRTWLISFCAVFIGTGQTQSSSRPWMVWMGLALDSSESRAIVLMRELRRCTSVGSREYFRLPTNTIAQKRNGKSW